MTVHWLEMSNSSTAAFSSAGDMAVFITVVLYTTAKTARISSDATPSQNLEFCQNFL